MSDIDLNGKLMYFPEQATMALMVFDMHSWIKRNICWHRRRWSLFQAFCSHSYERHHQSSVEISLTIDVFLSSILPCHTKKDNGIRPNAAWSVFDDWLPTQLCVECFWLTGLRKTFCGEFLYEWLLKSPAFQSLGISALNWFQPN